METIKIFIEHELLNRFPNIIPIIPDETGQRFEVLCDTLIYYPDENIRFTIPSGYISNLASIPKRFWSIAAPLDYHWRAAIIHDYMYDHPEIINSQFKLADRLFKQTMYTHNTKPWKVHSFYFLVKHFGFRSWLFKKILSKFIKVPGELK